MQLIGINNNVIISKALYKADGNSLVVTFDRFKMDEMEALMSGANVSASSDKPSDVTVFVPAFTAYGTGAKKEPSVYKEEFLEFRRFARHLLSPYYTEEELNEIFKGEIVFKGLEINNPTDLLTALSNEKDHAKICGNILKALERALNVERVANTPVRLKMIRKSSDKTFPTWPFSGFDNDYELSKGSGFIEPMSIPDNMSKLRFSMYERGFVKQKGPDGKEMKDEKGKAIYVKADNLFDRSTYAEVEEAPETADVNTDKEAKDINDLFNS